MREQTNTSVSIPFSDTFDCNKMKLLVKNNDKQSFNERFSQWLQSYTKPSREKIWMDIESYR